MILTQEQQNMKQAIEIVTAYQNLATQVDTLLKGENGEAIKKALGENEVLVLEVTQKILGK